MLICAAAFGLLYPTHAFCQAMVNFENTTTTLIRQPDSPSSPGSRPLFGFVQLAFAPTGTPLDPPTTWGGPSEYYSFLSRNPGWLFADVTKVENGLFGGGTLTLDGIIPGSTITYAVFAWGPWETVEASYNDWTRGSWGFAGPFYSSTGGGSLPVVSLAGTLPEITLPRPGPIPEPSIAALVILGAVVAYRARRYTRER